MAERNPPLFQNVSSTYQGADLGLPYRDIVEEGVIDGLAVTTASGMNVSVAAGSAWVMGTTTPASQPTYRVYNDGAVTKAITSDGSNPRRVLVVAQVIDQTYAGASRTWTINAVHGTAASSPSDPAIPASSLRLARIHVPAGATSIAAGNITDLRQGANVGGVTRRGLQLTVGSFSVAHSTETAVPWTSNISTAFSNDFTLANNAITVQRNGWYEIEGAIQWSGSPAYTKILMGYINGVNVGRDFRPNDAVANWCHLRFARYLTAGIAVGFNAWQGSGGTQSVAGGTFSIVRL